MIDPITSAPSILATITSSSWPIREAPSTLGTPYHYDRPVLCPEDRPPLSRRCPGFGISVRANSLQGVSNVECEPFSWEQSHARLSRRRPQDHRCGEV